MKTIQGTLSRPQWRGSTVAAFSVTLLLAAAQAGNAAATMAQTGKDSANTAQRPRIALALSGGGARGAAHIGVLKVLEELHVPIDCIAGTSMGSIVGGIYASGAGVDELEHVIADTNWNEVFNDRPPRAEIAVRRKLDDVRGFADPEFGVGENGVTLPKGLVTGVTVENFLRQLTRRAAGTADFSRLPVPFRAVAADIESGDEVVLTHGSLAHALRASMSIPGVMAPVEIDGHLLVDGGIANNLPIELARQMCGDIVIAVNIQTPTLKRDEITSAVSISTQLINLLGKSAVDRQIAAMRADDLLITPDLGGITSSSFERQREAIEIGRQAALAVAEQLRRHSIAPPAYAAWQDQRQSRASDRTRVVDAIRFEGLERTNEAVLRDLLKTRPDEPIKDETLAADMRRLYGRGDFEGIDYHIENSNGVRTLLIEPREKSWGPDYLRFGIGLSSDFTGESSFSLLGSYRQTWLNRLGGEWVNEAQLGRTNGLRTEFYQPLNEAGRFFSSTYALYQNEKHSLFVNEERLASYHSNEFRAGQDMGITFGTVASLRAGLLWRNVRLERDTGTPLLPDFSQHAWGARVQFYADQLDRPWFPRSGYMINASATRMYRLSGDGADYSRLEGRADSSWSHGDHTLTLSLSGGTDLGTHMPWYDQFSLGGPLRLSSYRPGELQGQRFALARAEYYNRAIRLPSVFGTAIYLGASLEAGGVGNLIATREESGPRYSGSVFFAADTALGSAYLGIGAGDNGETQLYFVMGVP